MASLTVRKRGKGWEYRFDVAKIDGKRKQVSKAGFKTKGDALAAGTKALNEYNNTGISFKPSDLSVADYMNYWLDTHVKKNLAYNTYIGYKRYVKLHINPAFGIYKLSALSNNPAAIQDWITNLKIQGYSRNMIKNLLGCLSGAMRYAVIPCKYITSNPCTYVTVPVIETSKETREHTEYICSVEDFKKITERFDENSNFYLPLILGYHLGTRISESYAIDFLNDVDFKSNTVTINYQILHQTGKWIFKTPKYNSVRTLKIDSFLSNALHKEYIKQRKNMLKYGEYYIKTYIDEHNTIIQLPASIDCTLRQIMPVSVRENGELLTPESFKYCAKIVHFELGLVNFHSHALRHTHGTILAENGVSPKTVMERLGHKDIATTLQTYVFNTAKMQDNAVEIFEKFAHI